MELCICLSNQIVKYKHRIALTEYALAGCLTDTVGSVRTFIANIFGYRSATN